MAAIDKIYGTYNQATFFYNWASKNYPDLLNNFYDKDSFNHLEYSNDRPISNFTEEQDMLLMQVCNIDFVQLRLAEQYSFHMPTVLPIVNNDYEFTVESYVLCVSSVYLAKKLKGTLLNLNYSDKVVITNYDDLNFSKVNIFSDLSNFTVAALCYGYLNCYYSNFIE